MKLAEASPETLSSALSSGDFVLHCGPFRVRIQASSTRFAGQLQRIYGDSSFENPDGIADFHIRLSTPVSVRGLLKPQVRFLVDGQSPFAPFPADHAFPLLEWGLNWCVASHAHQYLMLHSAVVEKNGLAVLLPAWPGSGKSTLCAALVYRGWRLLSDEFGLVRPGSCEMTPFPRSIPLKNQSIDIIARFAPEAVIGPVFPKTRKGDVAHLKPPADSVERAQETATPRYVVFPRYMAGQQAMLRPLAGARAFMKLAGNAFNYELLGEHGFTTVASLIRSCDSYLFHYDNLDEAVQVMNALVE